MLEFCSKNSINFIVIRPVMVYGENDIKGNMYKLIKQIHKGFFPLLNKGKTRKSTIYVKNLTSIIIEVCQSEKYNGKFIIAADSDVLTMKNICFFIREHLNTKCFFVYLPKFTVHILVFMIGLLQQLGLVKGMNSGSLEKLVIDTVYEIDEHSDELIKMFPSPRNKV
ncbi:hypothetical protein EXW96_22695 [Paenibacillus sp. JMULE4]|uniref:hypothetical protein n=1 Tax=Paenibacillus sp. JMULE4 TaxID=2518342 RepID=UPI0028162294|nr:hypothetical protein [Paenibacillus sp. JMULE4]NTZ20251.1 hypothetical protein [Paenibacillus sp. JMULE4]